MNTIWHHDKAAKNYYYCTLLWPFSFILYVIMHEFLQNFLLRQHIQVNGGGRKDQKMILNDDMQSESKAIWGVAKLYLPRSLTLTAIQEYKMIEDTQRKQT